MKNVILKTITTIATISFILGATMLDSEGNWYYISIAMTAGGLSWLLPFVYINGQ